jgi:hypothetical protein
MEFQTEADCLPNINNVVVAGKIVQVEPLAGKVVGLRFQLAYQKHWPDGHVQEIRIPCYLTGQARTDKADWLTAGEWVLVRGEVTDRGAVYALQIEQLSKATRSHPDDAYLQGLDRSHTR